MTRTMLIFMFCFVWTKPCIASAVAEQEEPQSRLVVASKNFPESSLLAEIMSQILEIHGFTVERKYGLGGTLVSFEALVNSRYRDTPAHHRCRDYAVR